MTLGRNTIMRLSRQYAASESAKKAVVRGSWFVKAHHHSEWAVVKYHSGPPSHGCPFWQPSCAFRWSAPDGPKRLSGRPLRTRPMAVFFLVTFISIACMRYVGDVLIKASRCESWVGPFWYMGLFFKHHPSCISCTSHFRRAALAGSAPTQAPGGAFFTS